jgi:hypothetical protein
LNLGKFVYFEVDSNNFHKNIKYFDWNKNPSPIRGTTNCSDFNREILTVGF